MSALKPTADSVFHALGDPTRRAIVERLSRGPESVSRLAMPLRITPTAVIQHLRVLERAGLANTEKAGRVRTCSIRPDGFLILNSWIDDQRSLWEQRLDRLAALLDK